MPNREKKYSSAAGPKKPYGASNPASSMSVDDFRRLVQELYLEPEAQLAEAQFQAGASVHNAAILVDTSSSMERSDPQLVKLKDSLTRFAAQLAAHAAQGIRLNVCLIGFSEKITVFFAVENFTDFAPQADDPFYKAIHSLAGRGGTNYQAAFHKAGAWLAERDDGQATSSIFFITDGKPTCYYHDAFTHSIPSSKSGAYIYNGMEFSYSGKGRIYYDADGRAVAGSNNARRYRAAGDGRFEARVGSSVNWSEVRASFEPAHPARRVKCALPQYYLPGKSHYFDASGKMLSDARGAAYRISASGNFEQYRKGAWHPPQRPVAAAALDENGVAHFCQTNRAQGGSGVSSGMLETGKSLRACREITEKTSRLSLHAIGIGSAVDPAMLNLFDSAANARILIDTSQMAEALASIAHSDFSAVLPDLPAESPAPDMDMLQAHGFGAVHGITPEDMSEHGDMPVEAADLPQAAPFHSDSDLLAGLGSDLLEGDDELIIDAASLSAMPADPAHAVEIRHFSYMDEHINLHDLFGEDATVDFLLPRVTASHETRTINGETVEDLVLHVHAGDGAMTPVVQTIVLEDFAQHSHADDLHILLQHLLHV